MPLQMNLFAGAVVDCLVEQLKIKLLPARMSFTRLGNSCHFYVQKGKRKVLKDVTVQSNAQVRLCLHSHELTFSLSHPDAINRLVEQLVHIIQVSLDPFEDESLGPELLRRLLVWKAMKVVEGRTDEENTKIHSIVSQALKDLGLKPMRFPNSGRDQIRRAFLLLVGLESAPKSCKASWMEEFQVASYELGTMRIDGTQIAFNPYLLYRKIIVDEALRRDVEEACRPFQSFVEEETIDTVIEAWTP